jgi:hypothetical protein
MSLNTLGTSATVWIVIPAQDNVWWMYEYNSCWSESWQEKVKYSVKICPRCHFVHLKSHVTWSGIESSPPRWKASYRPQWHGLLWKIFLSCSRPSCELWEGRVIDLSTVRRWSSPCAYLIEYTPWRHVGKWRYSPTILNLGTGWRWVVRFTPRPLYPREKSPWYRLL